MEYSLHQSTTHRISFFYRRQTEGNSKAIRRLCVPKGYFDATESDAKQIINIKLCTVFCLSLKKNVVIRDKKLTYVVFEL